MASLTKITGIWMIGRLALGNYIVMAADTTTDDLVVIQWRNKARPGSWWNTMASLTNICRVWMVCRFTSRDCAIMATKTGADHFIMVNG